MARKDTRTLSWLATKGPDIIDTASNEKVILRGVNWFGFETETLAPHGLWARSLDSLLDCIAACGFNLVRMPFCNDVFRPGAKSSGISSCNCGFENLTPLELMDKVVDGCASRGIYVLLDRHRPTHQGQSELWYTSAVDEAQWISDWCLLADRYRAQPAVCGADLHNEPHGSASWQDWAAAATRCGDAIHKVHPEWLIIVEGVEKVSDIYYWWGGNLRGALSAPVRLTKANKLVYSPHDYPASVYAQPWLVELAQIDSEDVVFTKLSEVWDQTWGYLARDGHAPILLGEFGTKLETPLDRKWLSALLRYIAERGISFSYWSLNPNSGDTGGLLRDDWWSMHSGKMEAMRAVLPAMMDCLIPSGGNSIGTCAVASNQSDAITSTQMEPGTPLGALTCGPNANVAITDDWGEGCVVRGSFQAPVAANGWRVEMKWQPMPVIKDIWCAEVLPNTGHDAIMWLGHAHFNKRLQIGQIVEFGFKAEPGGVQGPMDVRFYFH